jgi:transposase, IS5 family
MGRNYLAHHAGDAANAVLAAAGYNFHLLLRWLELVLSRFLAAQKAAAALAIRPVSRASSPARA